MRLIILIMLLLLLCIQYTTAQQRITGEVIDQSTHTPLIGVLITDNSSRATATTDKTGVFHIVTSGSKAVLIFSSIGYQNQEITLNLPQAAPLKVLLTRKVTELEGVTITTGYQKIPKERATGSFTTVGNKLLGQQVTTNIMDRLPAIANGITMNRGISGTPQMMIRGLSTIKGPQGPLIVIDNFPYEGDISNINPNLVESITILKDAAAASIWGARAANGVIVITTKNAHFNQPINIEFTAHTTIAPKPDLDYLRPMTSNDFIDMETKLFELGYYDNDINSPSHPVLSPVVSLLNKEKHGLVSHQEVTGEINRLRQIDSRYQFKKYMYQPLVNRQYFLNISGGAPQFSWISSLGYDDNSGNLNEKYQRLNLRFQNTWKPVKSLTVNAAIYFTHTLSQSGHLGYGSINMKNGTVPYLEFADDFGNPIMVPTVYDQNFKDTAGNGKLQDWNYYPLTEWKHSTSKTTASEVMINTGINYKIIKGLDADIIYQYQYQSGVTNNLNDAQSYYARNYINTLAQKDQNGNISFIVPLGGILAKTNRLTSTHNLRGQINYNRMLNKSSINAVVGAEIRAANYKNDFNRYYGYNGNNLTVSPVDYTRQYPNFVNGNPEYILNGQSLEETNTRFVSLYANAAYTYDNRYTISGSVRRDASNLFGLKTNDQWNPFWSAGVAWNISNEHFYKFSFAPLLKLRASYGSSGNVNPAMVAVTTIAYYGENSYYTNTPMARIENYYNPNLKWERSRTFNLAVDFATKNNRISGSVEYFTKKGDNLFGTSPIDYTTGITSMLWNVAAMIGKGWDIQLKTANIDGAFRWNTILNLSIYHDKITHYYLSNTFARNLVRPGAVSVTGLEGLPVYSIFGYKWAGLDPENGDPKGYLNGKYSKDYRKIINADLGQNVLEYFGSAVPTTYGSFINSFNYKNFNLDIGIVYKLGYWFRRNSINYNNLFSNWQGHGDYALRWQKPGDELITNVPSNLYQSNSNRDEFYNGSSILIEKGDHIRLQYVNLGYELNKSQWNKMPAKSLQLYMNLNNLGILWRANKLDIDPDYNIGANVLKPTINYTLGLRATF